MRYAHHGNGRNNPEALLDRRHESSRSGYGTPMSSLGTATSYWMDTTAPTSYPALTSDTTADVAVVGGGIAGLCTAWELARAGRSVAIVEADRIVASTTGHTTAKLSVQHGLIYEHLRAALGAATARHYAQSQRDAVEHVADLVEELGIDCDFERRPSFSYTGSREQVGVIEAETHAAQEAGLPASAVHETGLPYPIAAAVRIENQAQFHPRRYLLALAEDLVRRGGRIFERSRVVSLDEGAPCRVTTDDGVTLVAADVVVATHYPIFDRAGLFSRLTPHRELVIAAPIAADRDPGGMYITSEDDTRSVRTAPYAGGQRLLIVTGESFTPGEPGVAERAQRLADWTVRHFKTQPSYHWAAQDNSTTDQLPYVGTFHAGAEHVYVATGFGGWGMSGGVMAGQLIAALIEGRALEWAGIYDPRRIHPVVEARNFVTANLENARRFIADRFRASDTSPDDLPAGTGAVMGPRGGKCAVYRDETGQLHAVSATCTHLGCTVAFNSLERTWDCPCHGSRFAPDGAVLHGPATRPLEPLDAAP